MENCYGIGIANRYDLFYVDDGAEPIEALLKKKAKKGAKVGGVAVIGGVEKENKPGQVRVCSYLTAFTVTLQT